MFKKNLKDLILFSFVLIFTSCNAPRDNPLDPYSPKQDLVEIEGVVKTQSVPFTPIANVSVLWLPGYKIVQTDTSGKFLIDNIKPVDGLLIFQKDGYLSDTVRITWQNAKKITTPLINLNKKPKMESISIYSEVINQSGQNQIGNLANLVFKVRINDTDDDIDSVFIKNLNLNFTDGLELQGKTYQGSFSTSELNVSDIEQTIGSKFEIWVMDKFNKYYSVGSGKVARVLKSGSEIISPVNDTLSIPLDLKWNQFNAGFPFTYKIEIYNSANLELVFSQENIQPNQISLQVDTSSITTGDYLWSILVVDQFLDSYKSQPGKFHIQ